MNLRINSWRRHLWIPALVTIVSILAVGARNIADELSSRPVRQRQTENKMREWSHRIVDHIDDQHGDQWRRLAELEPHVLIQACLVVRTVPLHHD